MKVTKTINYSVTFTIQYFETTEGGMDSGTYGRDCAELSDAIMQLELAQIAEPGREWIITAEVEKQA